MFRGKSSLLTGLSVGAAFIRAADTAGTSAHTTFGENKLNEVVGESSASPCHVSPTSFMRLFHSPGGLRVTVNFQGWIRMVEEAEYCHVFKVFPIAYI
jgi:hypothetical protein